jgi:hypothetical protein
MTGAAASSHDNCEAPSKESPATVPRHPRGKSPKGSVDATAPPPPTDHLHRPNEPHDRGSDRSGDGKDGGPPACDRHLRPSTEALRPLARALVALAMEVRGEGLEVGCERRSHGPTGKGGGRCAA